MLVFQSLYFCFFFSHVEDRGEPNDRVGVCFIDIFNIDLEFHYFATLLPLYCTWQILIETVVCVVWFLFYSIFVSLQDDWGVDPVYLTRLKEQYKKEKKNKKSPKRKLFQLCT